MLGAVFLGDREVELRNFPDPEPGPGEVVVAIRASGLCGTDLRYFRGARGTTANTGEFIGGHEPAGVVHAVGAGVEQHVSGPGDRVMVHHYVGCGRCDSCRTGWTQMCLTAPPQVLGTHAHGAHAPYLVVPASTLVPLDERLSFSAGAAIGCGTGTAWAGLDRLGDIGGRTVVVLGQGPVGASATVLATARGARVIAVDLEPSRLALSQELGAADVIDPSTTNVPEAVRDLVGGIGARFVLETSGASAAVADGLASLAPWGRMCIVGLGGEVRFETLAHYRRQADISLSWSMSIVQQRQCAEFIAERGIPIDRIFTHSWRLEQIAEAYDEFDRGAAGKGAIVFGGARGSR